MSFIERIRSEANARAANSVRGVASSAVSTVSGGARQAKSGFVSDILAPLNIQNFSPDMIADVAFGRTDPFSLLQATSAGRLQENALGGIRRAKALLKQPSIKAAGKEPIPTGLGTSRLWGGVSFDEHRNNFLRASSLQRSWKNLFHVAIKEFKPSSESFAEWGGLFNLLAMDVSLSPCTMPGEAVPIGGANMDRLAGTDRVELRMTTMDDDRGSIKRWFMAKCDQAAHQDGTFGVPTDYLVVITLTHMASTETAKSDPRLSQRFLMRPSNIDLELSRRAPELEELPLSFVQFDTFMEVR